MDRLLKFIQNYCNNSGIQSIHLTPKSDLSIPFDLGLRKLFIENFDYCSALQLILNNAAHTLLSFSDIYHCTYYLLTLPEHGHYFLVGPVLQIDINKDNISNALADTPIASQPTDQLFSYYERLPSFAESNCLITLLITLAHEFYPDKTVSLHNISLPASTFISPSKFDPEDDIAIQAQLKSHYAYLDLQADAIRRGDYADALIQMNKQQRSSSLLMSSNLSPLMATQKGLYIQNTIHRMTAHNCGIDPQYLRAISQKFSKEIDEMTDPSKDAEIRRRMLYAYCEMINRCKISSYSPTIQRVITYTNKHLDDESLSLTQLARYVNVNSSYLSKLFKAEVNITLTEYLSKARIEKAIEYLKSGNIKIQDVAFSVGYTDTAYFTKCFRKRTGFSPSEFQKIWNLTGLK